MKAKARDINEIRPLNRRSIARCWHESAKVLVKLNGMTEDGEAIGINVDDARLVVLLCEGIEQGERNILKILKQHRKATP